MQSVTRYFVALAAVCVPALGSAQTYPTKSVLMIMPLQAGSSVDVGMRIVTQKMAESMGQQIVIDNQPGAAGLIGTERFMRSTPDGYTLATLNDSILTMIPNLYKKVAYDPLKSFAPVSLVAFNTWLLVNHPSLPVKSARELVALAKARPGEINYASGGQGSPQHIAMAMFEAATGAKMTHVPYKGTTQATLDVISGHIPVMFSATSLVIEQVREGKSPRAGGRRRPAAGFAAERADDCRVRRAGLRFQHVDVDIRAVEYAEGSRRAAQCRNSQGARAAGRERAAGFDRF
jgi:tripartite-type tricarboxylate transporter receptor subunit TctC